MSFNNSTQNVASVVNLRDVGTTVNKYLNKRLVREGILYRSARPDGATLEDQNRLRDELGIKSVLDLRSKTEHVEQAKKYQASRDLPALVQDNAGAARPLHIPGLEYREVSLAGRALQIHLVRQLSWASFFRLIYCFLFGNRIQGIAILGREVMSPRGLVGLGTDTLDQSQWEVAAALRSFTSPSGLPSLVHCTQGKDRTGLVIALVLMILDVPTSAIEFDYGLTDEGLAGEMDERLVEIRQIGLTEDWGRTDPNMIQGIVKHLQQVYDGLGGYFDSIGFDMTERAKLRDLLLY